MDGDLGLFPTGFSIGSIQINGKTLLEPFQLNLPGIFDFKALKDPEEGKLVTTSAIVNIKKGGSGASRHTQKQPISASVR